MKELAFGPSKLDYFPVPWCNLPAQYMLNVDCSHNAIKEIPEEISRFHGRATRHRHPQR